jgi:hypothetical protein
VVVTELLGDEANEAHIAGHDVARHEVVEIVFGADAIFAVEDTHRPMTTRERREYEEAQQ